ncbi:DoxX family protein [Rhodococcus sp. Eu-32]|uniref:DoxX family protein n=1 Tax=Rhodococcus sp. Eu-32 TaxID=1017319 RepID=UPI000DF2604D|nr:DoxX family protein [Rhodococcus sp. Eu-32]RRQ28992.1 DoxX family protein [Rhodococcus sp. Eu-32]
MTAADWGSTVLRLLLGIVIAAHGWNKFFAGGRIPGTARWFDSIGMRPGRFHALLAACSELGAGVLLIFGFLTPVACALVVSLMFVAAWTVHRGNGFFIVGNGWEYNLFLGGTAVVLAISGPGSASLDALIFGAGGLGPIVGSVCAAAGLAGAAMTLVLCFRPQPAART